MTFHRYRWNALRLELLQAVAGFVIVIVPLLNSFALPFLFIFFSLLAALFLGYGIRTALRGFQTIAVGDDAIALQGVGTKRIDWPDLARFSLSYFGSRQVRPKGVTPKGYMHLKLRGPHGTIKADSSIDDFHVIVEKALDAALANKLELDPVTVSNLEAMDLATREVVEETNISPSGPRLSREDDA